MKTRRFILKSGVAGAVGMAVPAAYVPRAYAQAVPPSPTLARYQDALPIPAVIDRTAGGSVNLPLAAGTHRFHASLPTTTAWGMGGMPYMGPTIVARRGRPLTVNLTNNLGSHLYSSSLDYNMHGALASDASNPRVSLHLHGANADSNNDGQPEDTRTRGQGKNYYYHNDQEGAGLWYHDHAIGITRLNVYAGLAGNYWLRDDNELSRNLPSGEYEIPLALQDKSFNSSGKAVYPNAPGVAWFEGDVAVVNGKAWPYLSVKRGWYRFRVVNACNTRTLQLYLGGKTMYQIGSDAGLLNAPVALTQLTLAPAERADVLINFSSDSSGKTYTLTNSLVGRGPVLSTVMQFRVNSSSGYAMTLPSTLRPTITRLSNPVKVRNLVLVERGGMMTLNNLMWHDISRIEQPKVNTVEQWNLINLTLDMHPIHLHAVPFQVMNRQAINVSSYKNAFGNASVGDGPWPAPSVNGYVYGSTMAPPANEMGWKDTVRCPTNQVTRILVPFGAGIPGSPVGNSFTGEYVWHCHILEHEDHDMMLRYRIVP